MMTFSNALGKMHEKRHIDFMCAWGKTLMNLYRVKHVYLSSDLDPLSRDEFFLLLLYSCYDVLQHLRFDWGSHGQGQIPSLRGQGGDLGTDVDSVNGSRKKRNSRDHNFNRDWLKRVFIFLKGRLFLTYFQLFWGQNIYSKPRHHILWIRPTLSFYLSCPLLV